LGGSSLVKTAAVAAETGIEVVILKSRFRTVDIAAASLVRAERRVLLRLTGGRLRLRIEVVAFMTD